jgi:hypothetical protein
MELVPQFEALLSRLHRGERDPLVEELRKKAFEAPRPALKAAYLLLQAEAQLIAGERETGGDLLTQALETLRRHWDHRSGELRLVAEYGYQANAIFHFQNGKPEKVRDCILEARARIGGRQWMIEMQAEVFLLEGRTEQCRLEVAKVLDCPAGMRPQGFEGPQPGLRLLVAETYLRERNLDCLEKSLKAVGTRTLLRTDDRATLSTLQVEMHLMKGNLQAAWRPLGVLHRLAEENPRDPGLKRLFQQTCARLHLAEGKIAEAHRRIQLAENESLYPVAQWETRLMLGMILEAEDRALEAETVWKKLGAEAVGTYYGFVAQGRLERYRVDPLPRDPALVKLGL